MTDAESDDGGDFHAEGLENGFRTNTATSTDPNRPDSALSSQTRPSTRAPPSRRGVGAPGSLNTLRSRGIFGGPASSVTNSSRPTSSTSRTSRTHVPSLASHAFFRPMSSQRLQAQRSVRPPGGKTSVSEGGSSDAGSNTPRQSLATNATELHENTLRPEIDVPPQSRGTEYTADEDRAIVNSSPEGQATLQSIGGSEKPLHQPIRMDIVKQVNGPLQKPTKTLGANFMRTNGNVRKETQGHERLPSSNGDSPTFVRPAPPAGPKAGINYQYFSGNTLFCWGGRLQNTRDRPINIATGIFVILPSILFLVYSWVSPESRLLMLIKVQILPRNLHPLPPAESEDPLAIPPPLTQWTTIKSAGSPHAAMDVPTKYCKTCRRNYRYFFSFVSSGTLLGIYLIFGSLAHCLRYASTQNVSFVDSIKVNRVPFAMFIYGILATPYPACLWAYHLWLIARGETTREYLNSHKFLKKDRHRPFTHGNMLKNWVIVLIRPRPPTYLQFKAKYQQGDQRFGPRRGKRQAPLVAEQQGSGMELQDVGGAKPT
ncbi:MAG: hypothetical protein Q9163_002193 [Psora crenata]